MSILINKNTKVITQGITGKSGKFHTSICKKYANGKNSFVAGVNPKKSCDYFNNIPIYETVKEAIHKTGATVSVIYVPPINATSAIMESINAGIDLIVCITEGIPIKDMIYIKNYIKFKKKKTLLLGPNCPGIITPEEIKIGIMPAHIHKKGKIGIVSKSGTLTYEAVSQVSEMGMGQSTAVGIGGDPIFGIDYIDVLRLFNEDKDTEAVIMIGEIGGNDEIKASHWIKKNMNKPVVGFIAGLTAPLGKKMGHAGALISDIYETAESKIEAMKLCGIPTTNDPSSIAKLLKIVI